jgi:multimeric flavodoxin WrbA
MKLLGVSAGAEGGSVEILLKAALMAAEAKGTSVSWLSLEDMRISTGPTLAPADDDCRWFFDQVMESDGVIYASPIYSRTTPGKLRLLTDRVFGPHADVGFIELLLERERAGTPVAVPFSPDERALRPRVAAFLVSGGALGEQWNTLALPLMSFSLRCGVVDQAVFDGSGTPASVVLQPAALERARLLGSRVAGQLGRSFQEVEYLGAPGLCPLCHLSVIDVRSGGVVECATCGAEGRMAADASADDGVSIRFDDPAGLAKSVIAMEEKRIHSEEILATAAAHAARADEVEAGAAPFRNWDGGRVRP